MLKDYRLFDAKTIESHLATPGFARIVSRFFPNYASTHKTLQLFGDEYQPIRCEHCGKDLLELLFTEDHKGVVVRLRRRKDSPDDMEVIADLYAACKGSCDEKLQTQYCTGTLLSAASWANLSDLVMPPVFLERIVVLLDQLGRDEVAYSPQALEKEKIVLRALAQYVLRESTDGELQRARRMLAGG